MSAKENRYAILGAWMLGEMGTAEGRGLASKKRKGKKQNLATERTMCGERRRPK